MRATGFPGLGLTIELLAIGFAIDISRRKLTTWRDANLTLIQQAPGGQDRPSKPHEDLAWIERAMSYCETEAASISTLSIF